MDDGICPCGTGDDYQRCCGPIHQRGAGLGVAAVALMRARYCAHLRDDVEFLTRSWHPDTRPAAIGIDPETIWQGLEIVATDAGTGLDHKGTVEFRATYHRGDLVGERHERSSFVRIDGQWVYVDGVDVD